MTLCILLSILGDTKTRKKSESQMRFEPTTLRDPEGLDRGGSWVQIPSGTRIFSESTFS